MKKKMGERERSLKQINLNLDYFDQLVNDGVLTRKELTMIVLHRHILAMKQVHKYMIRNLNLNKEQREQLKEIKFSDIDDKNLE